MTYIQQGQKYNHHHNWWHQYHLDFGGRAHKKSLVKLSTPPLIFGLCLGLAGMRSGGKIFQKIPRILFSKNYIWNQSNVHLNSKQNVSKNTRSKHSGTGFKSLNLLWNFWSLPMRHQYAKYYNDTVWNIWDISVYIYVLFGCLQIKGHAMKNIFYWSK